VNALNRLLVILLLLALLAGSVVLCLCLVNFDAVNGNLLHLTGNPQSLDAALAGMGQALEHRASEWEGIAAAVAIGSLLLLLLELSSVGAEKSIVLHRDARGTTALDMSALCDLVRWTGEGTQGVEGIPIARVKRNGKTLQVTGVALLNPYVNAQSVVPVLQQNVQAAVSRASGFSVVVKLRSRFQNPKVRRKPR
ncbi:MAG: hypothetical protein M3Y56_00920, partial [Armatimonadota bacterium]|nr:hypothetical protein [Armatimonadota bacterium]